MIKTKRRKTSWLAFSRASVTVVAVLAVVAGVTFAALQSQAATLKGNTIQTAVASLKVSSDDVTYTNTLTGYQFNNLVPGGDPMPSSGYHLYLRNDGTTPLAVKLSAATTLNNPDNVDLSKVYVVLEPGFNAPTQRISLKDLMTDDSTAGVALTSATRMAANQSLPYLVRVAMDADAVTSPSASINNLDLKFGAQAVN